MDKKKPTYVVRGTSQPKIEYLQIRKEKSCVVKKLLNLTLKEISRSRVSKSWKNPV